MLTVAEAAERAGLTHVALYKSIADGRLRAVKKYGRWVVAPKDLDAYLRTAGLRNGHRTRTGQPAAASAGPPRTGADLVARWQAQGLIGAWGPHPNGLDGAAEARAIRDATQVRGDSTGDEPSGEDAA